MSEIANRWEALNARWDENERRYAAERYAERAVLIRTVADALTEQTLVSPDFFNLASIAVDALIADGVVFARMGAV